MPLNIYALMPFILLWLSTSLFFVLMVRRNSQITDSAKAFWSIVVVVFWFQGALVYAAWGISAQIWDTSFKKRPIEPT